MCSVAYNSCVDSNIKRYIPCLTSGFVLWCLLSGAWCFAGFLPSCFSFNQLVVVVVVS
jgi:hypothetical protein